MEAIMEAEKSQRLIILLTFTGSLKATLKESKKSVAKLRYDIKPVNLYDIPIQAS
jgi:hypothetical protein